ncbi:MAG: hypothetical protein QNJ51_26535, partial [Calothrix sp. MO_167.B12]|nr:hypothetical protein [Calothrix sp. MO_167.B12]
MPIKLGWKIIFLCNFAPTLREALRVSPKPFGHGKAERRRSALALAPLLAKLSRREQGARSRSWGKPPR